MTEQEIWKSTHPKNILLAVDGSFQSFEAVRYVSRLLSGGQTRVTIFHVVSQVPESFWDLEHDPTSLAGTKAGRAWRETRKKMIDHFIERALKAFREAGYPKDLLPVVMRERQEGVARDIASEARRGYDAVVLGRRGENFLPGEVLGGVANKISNALQGFPVWVVGGKPETRKVLIAMDASRGAMRALEYAGEMVGSAGAEILLLNIQRGGAGRLAPGEPAMPELRPPAGPGMEAVLEKGREVLVGKGVDSAAVQTRIVRGVESRAGAIVDAAAKEGFGTIVVGRRGMSNVREFHMGRVASKTLQMARDNSVWIVS